MKIKTKKIRIEYINYGLAYTVIDDDGNKHIQINKELLNYPELYNITLEHELKHMNINNNKQHILFDLKEDFNFNNLKYFKFYIKHPKAFLSYAPFLIENKKIVLLPYNIISLTILILMTILYFNLI